MTSNELKYNVVYRDYYGNEQIIAAFAWMPEADAYIAAQNHTLIKDRLKVERIEDEKQDTL